MDNSSALCNNMCTTFVFSKVFAHMNTKPDYDQLYEIAESQAGYFTAGQARQVGFSWERLSANSRTGKFLRIAQGVYRLTHFPASKFEDLFIAWLRVGPRTVISHQSALAVYDLSDTLPGKLHVIIPRTTSRRHAGIRLHTNKLQLDEITSYEGMPITTVARTIADVTTSGMAEELIRQAVREGISRGLLSPNEMQLQIERRKGRTKVILQRILIGERFT